MNHDQVKRLLQRFHRQMWLIRLIRLAMFIGIFLLIFWAADRSRDNTALVFVVMLAAILGWIMLILNGAQSVKRVQTGSALITLGHLDDAEVWLRRALENFSLAGQSKILAVHYLANLFSRRNNHPEVVTICRELLRHRLKNLQQTWINVRLMLADSLLMLDRVDEAYEAIRPVYDIDLSLADRMRLLPIQLRYELAADHVSSATSSLGEKVQIAELLDSPKAALVHALLAEACRRENRSQEQFFLTERARLYHDLQPIAERYPLITPIHESM